MVTGSTRRLSPDQTLFSSTSLYASINDFTSNNDGDQKPKNFLSQYNKKEMIFRSYLPLSVLFSTFLSQPNEKIVTSISSPANINYTCLKDIIHSGKVFVINDFIDDTIKKGLVSDIINLVDTEQFAPSGLSNRAKGVQQGFSKKDRSVSPVTFDSVNNSQSLLLVGEYIDQLRLKLALVMNRPTMADITLGHESYFSRSLPGASLNRHLDERHEETKGRKGWTTPSRRSISWLLYLCEEDWDVDINGGGLLTFPQGRKYNPGKTGASGEDYGNLQVGDFQFE